jgi:hypothetical protein
MGGFELDLVLALADRNAGSFAWLNRSAKRCSDRPVGLRSGLELSELYRYNCGLRPGPDAAGDSCLLVTTVASTVRCTGSAKRALICDDVGSDMAVPKTYLTSTKNLEDILTAMQQAQAPKQFSTSFLHGLGFKSSADRLVIGMLKSLGFLAPGGAPTSRYFEFLDQTQSGRVLAEAMREAYGDLFELNTSAQTMSRDEIKNKLKTLTQGQFSDDVLGKMATTFVALAAEADFDAVEPAHPPAEGEEPEAPAPPDTGTGQKDVSGQPVPIVKNDAVRLGGLVYNIQIQLPESRDPAVYDALFRSLRTHLFHE